MGPGERGVVRAKPVLGRKREIEAPKKSIYKRDDAIAVRYRQLAAGHERRLNVDQPQNVGPGVELHWRSPCPGRCCAVSFVRLGRANKKTTSKSP